MLSRDRFEWDGMGWLKKRITMLFTTRHFYSENADQNFILNSMLCYMESPSLFQYSVVYPYITLMHIYFTVHGKVSKLKCLQAV